MRARVVVFVDGCFWHACPLHGTRPKANKEWWRVKLQSNVARDRDTDSRLLEAGWTVIRAWEHEEPSRSCRSHRTGGQRAIAGNLTIDHKSSSHSRAPRVVDLIPSAVPQSLEAGAPRDS